MQPKLAMELPDVDMTDHEKYIVVYFDGERDDHVVGYTTNCLENARTIETHYNMRGAASYIYAKVPKGGGV